MIKNWKRELLIGGALAAATLITRTAEAQPGTAQSANEQMQVLNGGADPAFANVCHLAITRRVFAFFKMSFTGTAVLYRGRYLLTAGHNVYQDNSRIKSVEVRCGAGQARNVQVNEVIEPWQAIDATGYDGAPFALDFGVIRLSRPIVVVTPVHLATISAQSGDAVRFAGYPGGPHTGWDLFEARGKIVRLEPGLAFYDIATFKSNSGGPIWRDTADGPELLAVHVTSGGGRIVDESYRGEVEKLIEELDRRAAQRAR